MPNQFNKIPNDDHEAESLALEGMDSGPDSSASQSGFLTKYSYLSPKAKYGIGAVVLVLLGSILLSAGGSGDNKSVDSSIGAGAGAGSGSGPVIDTIPTPEIPNDNDGGSGSSGSSSSSSGGSGSGSSSTLNINKDPSTWNPTILEWEDLEDIASKLETERDAMLFKRKIFEGVTYMQKTFIFMQSNATFEDLDENGEVESESEMGVAEQYQVEFDDIITIKDNVRGEKNIEYMVSRLAVLSFDDEGNEIEIDSNEEYDDDEVVDFLDDVIGKKSMVKLDKYDQVLETSDEETFLEQLQEIAPGMSAMDMYDETSRMAQNLPIKAVKVGDTWALSMKVKGMDYNGGVTLLGYTIYDGSECAVFDIQATLTLDIPDLIEDMGGEDNLEDGFNDTVADLGLNDGISIKDGLMTGKMFWDVQHHFPRYSLREISMVMEMMDPFDENEKIEFPSYEVVDMYMSI